MIEDGSHFPEEVSVVESEQDPIFSNLRLKEKVQRLQAVVEDLNRRIQNSNYIIESEKKIAHNANDRIVLYRQSIYESSHILNLEMSKRLLLERSKLKEVESINFESKKKDIQDLHRNVKLAEIDHMMTNLRKEPERLLKLRRQLRKMEEEQGDRKILLQQLSEAEQLEEDLNVAVQSGRLDDCKALLDRGVDINHKDLAGFLPLHYAIAGGDVAMCELLLKSGADFSSYVSGSPPLVTAAAAGHITLVQLLIDAGAHLDDKGLSGLPALHAAVDKNHGACVRLLLSLGADPNDTDLMQNTALHVAVSASTQRLATLSAARESNERINEEKNGLRDMVRLLLDAGADKGKVNMKTETALHTALREMNLTAVHALGQGVSPYNTAATDIQI